MEGLFMSHLYKLTNELIADIDEAFHIFKTETKTRETEADFLQKLNHLPIAYTFV